MNALYIVAAAAVLIVPAAIASRIGTRLARRTPKPTKPRSTWNDDD